MAPPPSTPVNKKRKADDDQYSTNKNTRKEQKRKENRDEARVVYENAKKAQNARISRAQTKIRNAAGWNNLTVDVQQEQLSSARDNIRDELYVIMCGSSVVVAL